MNLGNSQFIDLTYTLHSTVPNWGIGCGFDCQIKVDYQDSKEGTKFRTQHLQMRAGIGTHMDAPNHCIEGGMGIAEIPLENLIRPFVVINVERKAHETYQVSREDIHEFELAYGTIPPQYVVIVHTGWGKYWNQEKFRNGLQFPSVSIEAAEILLKRGIVSLGIDTLSADTGTSGFPVHQLLLENNIYLIENISNSEKLPPVGGYLITFPLKIQDGTESPVRLIAVINN
jgi:kynurenine formamidase